MSSLPAFTRPLTQGSRLSRAIAVAAAVVLTGSLAACGSDGEGVESEDQATDCTAKEVTYGELDEEVEAQEVDESELVVYSGRSEDLVGPILEKYSEETGTTVSVRYGGTPAITAQLLEEGDASPADVFLAQDAGALGALADANCLAELPEETTGQVDAAYQSDTGNWVALTGRARVVIYNPSLVAEADLPSTLDDVLDPKWAGKVGVAPTNAGFQSMITALRVLEGDDAAEEFLTGLVDNDAVSYEGNGDIVAAVNSGEVAMGLVNHYYLFEIQAELGADAVVAKNHYLADGGAGSLVNISGAGILSTTDKADKAAELVDYLLGADAQAYFAETTNEYPMVDGAPEPVDAPPLEELEAPTFDLNDLDSLAETQQLIADSGLS